MEFRGITWFTKKFEENTDFLQISKKNAHFSGFLTYVNFSLSAKFNRFFIILGGVAVDIPGNHGSLKKPRKTRFFVVFRGF